MKKTLGRFAGAMLAGAVISLAVTPAALAQDETTTTPPAPTSETPTTAPSPSWTGGKVTSAPPESSAPASSSSQQPTQTSSGKPTSGKPSPTSTSEKPTTPPEEPYVDNIGAGYIGDNGVGALVIACEPGEPSNVSAPDFDILYSNQAEDDGRYWVYIVKVKKSFKGNSSTFTWTCDGKPGKADIEFEAPIGGGAATPGKPEKQVKYAPKGGIETGFGATAA
ncbi:hypothetical protein DMC61_02320 [Amycolatopsis sp. WAC 04169]|uniref:hypothetical protein n=1 Tax=Amycolatopsis sp. WAC 04169 TaxID=2203197 RepID=UPI000F77FE70|nr:hypothetical protein [Amycolatopsis sp. WAC 04169]RSN36930.1 hypothetical protein DMC61_02320 [Amycolatopsis sp. WAC 04169]